MPASSDVDTPQSPARGRIFGAIPARFGSTRLPGKPLRRIAGRTLIEHVYRRATDASGLDRVVVLTDDERIAEAVSAFGGACEMTPTECASGTDRIAHAARSWDVDAVVNIQGDEPLIDAEAIDSLAEQLRHSENAMLTLAAPAGESDLDDPNVVKVVCDLEGRALYFSRSAIPFARNSEGAAVRRHIGVYGYRLDTLIRLSNLEPSPLERRESLEQLRALENGITIRVLEVEHAWQGVDTIQDLERVEAQLEQAATSES